MASADVPVGTVPVKAWVDALKCSQDGSAAPFASVALQVSVWRCRAEHVLLARVKLTASPSFQVWVAVWLVTVGALAGVSTEKVSDVDRPLVSVAVTLRLRPAAVLGTVPVKLWVEGLKFNQDGSAAPFAS